jgi:SAM-dependent methyltransferase
MRETDLKQLRDLEDRYWWFVARRRLALALLDREGLTDARLLDCGCGGGALLAALSERGWEVGVDVAAAALALTRDRGLSRLVQSDAQAIALRSDTFDAATLCDVLEHVEDDDGALREVVRVLKPGGIVIASFPALGALWSGHDEALGHYRRYSGRRVRGMMREAGLCVERLSYGLFFLLPLALVLRPLQRLVQWMGGRQPRTGIIAVPEWANRCLLWLMDRENALIRRISLPIGVSIVVAARKANPDGSDRDGAGIQAEAG